MRQGITGLIAGVVLGSLLAGGAAFALDSSHLGTRDVPATVKARVSYARQSVAVTGSVDATKHVGVPDVKPVRPRTQRASVKPAVHKHSTTCTHSETRAPATSTQPKADDGDHHTAEHGTVTAAPTTGGGHMGGHDGEAHHE